MLVSREIVRSLLQRISKLLTQEKVRNKTAGGAVFGKFFLENKTCLFSRNWKMTSWGESSSHEVQIVHLITRRRG